uniref:Uncharacterized protein n=1 Tax=Schistocephalus solidus TaxID=70667 RepID=A0A0V0J9Z3_SCHSO
MLSSQEMCISYMIGPYSPNCCSFWRMNNPILFSCRGLIGYRDSFLGLKRASNKGSDLDVSISNLIWIDEGVGCTVFWRTTVDCYSVDCMGFVNVAIVSN